MKKIHNYWFPDGETHLPKMLNVNFQKSNIAEYQFLVRSASLEQVKNFRVAIDIGANIGLWARDLCNHFDTVIAFEPIETFVECLKLNIQKENLDIYKVGLGDKETTAHFIITENNMASTHIDPTSLGTGEIQIKTLDSYNFSTVDYIKIDCEGYEYKILQGSKETILRCRPIIVIEQKPHKHFIEEFDQFDGLRLLESWGMIILDRVKKDFILGWPNK